MLAFDDEGLARLCIAGTAVPRDARADWLLWLAEKFEPVTCVGTQHALDLALA